MLDWMPAYLKLSSAYVAQANHHPMSTTIPFRPLNKQKNDVPLSQNQKIQELWD